MNKDAFRKDFSRHEHIKSNLARIKKKRLPVYAGRAGALPPLEGSELGVKREGSAPTSADARLVNQSYDSRQNRSDYHTVVHQTANPVSN